MARNKKNRPERQEWKIPAPLQILRGVLGGALSLVKIAVGGNYNTDANADENFSQNLINDISFEYYLNDAHTMYVRLFRHTGYESILEGEITQTGVGFVYRRKLRRVGDMFLPVKYVKRLIEKQNNRYKDKANDNAR